MDQNLKYPIKYALLELKEHGGWEHNYEDIPLCYIVSPCYVINQNIRYYSDETTKTTYEVVFPYKDIHTYKYLKRFNEHSEKPHFSSYNCLNSNIVSNLFDTYEEANITAEIENKNKRKNIFCSVKNYNQILDTFNKNLEICKEFEQLVLERTKNIQITQKDINVKKLTRKKEIK